jgi:hypothetical protein
MSPWAWLGFAAVAVVVLGGLVFVGGAILSGVRDAQRQAQAEGACPRCGHPIGEPWPTEGTTP